MNIPKTIVKNWVLPQAGLELAQLGYTLLQSLNPKNRGVCRYLSQGPKHVQNLHCGQDCYILATGPSLATIDITKFTNKVTIGVGSIFKHPDTTAFPPTYYIDTPNHAPFGFEYIQKNLDLVDTVSKGRTICLLGYTPYVYSYANLFQKMPDLWRSNYFFVDYTRGLHIDSCVRSGFRDSMWDLCGAPFLPRTVLYSAIQLASYLGCKNIYLLGCDHDYIKNFEGALHRHFYKEEADPNSLAHESLFTSERWYYEYYRRWRGFRIMRDYLKRKGRRVVNLCESSMIDVFEREPLPAGLLKITK